MTTHNNTHWPDEMFALAPLDATHIYVDEYRKQDGHDWYALYNGSWLKTEPICKPDYTEIPARERELNRAADKSSFCSYSKMISMSADVHSGIIVTWNEWQERRRIRIEAGLIKENNNLTDVNDTDVVEMDNLTWLAKNCNEWHTESARLAFVDTANEEPDYYFPQSLHPDQGYTINQWLQRRIELGLATTPAKPEQWKDGWPPLHKDCLVSDSQGRREIVKPLAYDEQIVVYKSYSDDIYYDFSHYTNFSPIETAEQKAERERQSFIAEAQKQCTEFGSNQIGKIYDWLIDTGRLTKEGE